MFIPLYKPTRRDLRVRKCKSYHDNLEIRVSRMTEETEYGADIFICYGKVTLCGCISLLI